MLNRWLAEAVWGTGLWWADGIYLQRLEITILVNIFEANDSSINMKTPMKLLHTFLPMSRPCNKQQDQLLMLYNVSTWPAACVYSERTDVDNVLKLIDPRNCMRVMACVYTKLLIKTTAADRLTPSCRQPASFPSPVRRSFARLLILRFPANRRLRRRREHGRRLEHDGDNELWENVHLAEEALEDSPGGRGGLNTVGNNVWVTVAT